MSSSLSMYLRVFHSCTILTLYFFYLSFDRGQMIVAAGLYVAESWPWAFIAQGRRIKASFDFRCLFYSRLNLTTLLSYYHYEGEKARGRL